MPENASDARTVDQEAEDLLKTACRLYCQLEYAKKLQRQKSVTLSRANKESMDNILETMEKTLYNIARLEEHSTVEIEVSDCQCRLSTCTQFVLRDLTDLPLKASRLDVAACNLETTISVNRIEVRFGESSGRRNGAFSEFIPPPKYEESEWFYAGRQKNLQRRASAMAMRSSGEPCQGGSPSSSSGITHVEHKDMPIYMFPALHDGQLRPEPVDTFKVAVQTTSPAFVESSARRAAHLTGSARSRSWLDYHTQH